MRSMDLVGMYGNGNGMIVMFGMRRGLVVVVGGADLVDGEDEGRREVVHRDLGRHVDSSRGSSRRNGEGSGSE